MKGHKSRSRLEKRIKWYDELIRRLPAMQEKAFTKPGSNKK